MHNLAIPKRIEMMGAAQRALGPYAPSVYCRYQESRLVLEPSVRGLFKQTLGAAAMQPRTYEPIETYVPHRGASAADAAAITKRLTVESIDHGVVSAAYTVDDEAIGETWRSSWGVENDDNGLPHVSLMGFHHDSN